MNAIVQKIKNFPIWVKISAVLLLVFLLGLGAEYSFRLPAIRAAAVHGNGAAIDLSEAELSGGFVRKDGVIVLEGERGTVHVPLDGSYISDFVCSYHYDGLMNASVRIGTKNLYGESREKEAVERPDRNMSVLPESHIPVNGKADWAEITVTRDGLDEAGLSHMNFRDMTLEMTGFRTEVNTGINPYRLAFIWSVLLLLAGAVFARKFLFRRMETGFLVTALLLGTLLSVSLPANKIGWDEEVHFRQAFWLANYSQPVDVTQAVMNEFITGMDTWPYNQPGSRDEQNMLEDYLDTNARIVGGEHHWSTDLNWTTVTGYVGEGLFLKIGEILKLPFSALFRLGRLGNLYVYILVMALAIRITPVGKPILAFLGLMPEPMFLAGVYSYDPTVTAFLCLFFAMLLRVWADPQRKMTWIWYAEMLLIFAWGCRIKAVYAPLLLMGLLIPKERFRSERERKIMRAGFVMATVLLMASFVLPVVFAPRDVGDTRGVETSEKGQMAYIFGQPISYAVILAGNMIRTLPSYVLGEESLGQLGHPLPAAFPWIFYAGSLWMILTGNREDTETSGGRDEMERQNSARPGSESERQEDRGRYVEKSGAAEPAKRTPAGLLNGTDRIWMFLLIAGTAVLIWTSMYIAFTTPGNTYIDGVQGRYYLPLLFPLWLIMVPSFIRVRMSERVQQGITILLSGGILAAVWFAQVYLSFCR